MESLFNVNDKIICVDSSGQLHLIEGKSYTVKNIHRCKCGHVRIDVGNGGCGNECKSCIADVGACIYYQTRFIKPDTDAALSDQITEALNEDLKVKL